VPFEQRKAETQKTGFIVRCTRDFDLDRNSVASSRQGGKGGATGEDVGDLGK
jgi:hypothetical protein